MKGKLTIEENPEGVAGENTRQANTHMPGLFAGGGWGARKSTEVETASVGGVQWTSESRGSVGGNPITVGGLWARSPLAAGALALALKATTKRMGERMCDAKNSPCYLDRFL